MATKEKALSAADANAELREEVGDQCRKATVEALLQRLTSLGAAINPTAHPHLPDGTVVVYTGIKFVQKSHVSAAAMVSTGNGHIIKTHGDLMTALFGKQTKSASPPAPKTAKKEAAEESVDP